MKKQSGFTLIEIAIVLVIIGLLLGGVLKGQEMMTNAKIKRTSNDFNGISAAIFSYLDRYGAFPGDDPNANARWGAVDGDGDGIIDAAGDGCFSGNAESVNLWDHLRRSGLVGGTGTNYPNHAFGGRIDVTDSPVAGVSGVAICMDVIEGKVAEILDRQLDDGASNAGELQDEGGAANYVLTTSYIVAKKL